MTHRASPARGPAVALLAIAALAAGLPAAAGGPEPRLAYLGIALDQPLALPECPTRAMSRGILVYDPPVQPCWRQLLAPQQDGGGKPPAEGQVSLRQLAVPDAIDAGGVTVSLYDGKVALVSAGVPRRADQDAVFAQLQAQFGTPTTLERGAANNLYGEKVPTLMASWELPDGRVLLTGATTLEGNGNVTVLTRAEIERLKQLSDAPDDDA